MRVVIDKKLKTFTYGELDCGEIFRFTDGTSGIWMVVEDFGDENGDVVANAICLQEYRTMVVSDEREVYVAKDATLKLDF